MMRLVRIGTVEVNDDVDDVARDLLVQVSLDGLLSWCLKLTLSLRPLQMLDRDETSRPSLEQIKQHPWFASMYVRLSSRLHVD